MAARGTTRALSGAVTRAQLVEKYNFKPIMRLHKSTESGISRKPAFVCSTALADTLAALVPDLPSKHILEMGPGECTQLSACSCSLPSQVRGS